VSDTGQAAIWAAILAGGLVICILLHKAGVPMTHVRDLLHVGAGSWVFGWPFWHAPWLPLGIAVAAVVLVALVPILAPRIPFLKQLQESVSNAEERWGGLTLYALAFALMTWLAWRRGMFPAAAALLALAIGDGLGGAIGVRFGRHFFRAGGKRKSLEGSLAVALGAGLGVWMAGIYFGAPPKLEVALGAALVASASEALAPRATDNLSVPMAVWLFVYATANGQSL
jgi:phytol kinase